LAPDVPVPVLSVIEVNKNPGMAMNVLKNINSLIDEVDIITNKNWETIIKNRYVHEVTNHTFFRVDSGPPVDQIEMKKVSYDYDIIVISDYDKGFISEMQIAEICKNHNNVFIDSKKILGDWAINAKIIKINDTEYRKSKNNLIEFPELEKKIIHTLGANGCEHNGINYPVEKVEVKDVSGAGDSFMAALVVKYLATKDIVQSIKFANKCASEVVAHRGVTTI
jgi:D-beta-D-heptose 7-phosphate kinase/D-beta-D-heptose 1-phosphate adenosyltransferase